MRIGRSAWFRVFVYLWVLPNTAIGLVCAFLASLSGAGCKVTRGALEVTGGWFPGRVLPRWFPAISTMTLGHVILSIDESSLQSLRSHEHVHIAQYERWGLLFIPIYLASSLVQWVRHRDPYRDNFFEKEAFGRGRNESTSGPADRETPPPD